MTTTELTLKKHGGSPNTAPGDVPASELADPVEKLVHLHGAGAVVVQHVEELLEVLSFKLIKLHNRPVILLNTNGYYDPMVAQFERCYEEQFAAHYDTGEPAYLVANTPTEVIQFIEEGG